MIIQFIKKLLGLGPSTDYKALISNGAIIIDVRSKQEFASGHIPGSINIPVEAVAVGINKYASDKTKPIITCCASGMRSGVAKGILMTQGYTEIYNAGSWYTLMKELSE